jgi:hypothetical protein
MKLDTFAPTLWIQAGLERFAGNDFITEQLQAAGFTET